MDATAQQHCKASVSGEIQVAKARQKTEGSLAKYLRVNIPTNKMFMQNLCRETVITLKYTAIK